METLPRHVWVDVTGKWVKASPGILLEWRRAPKDPKHPWEAWVIRVDVYSTGSGFAEQVVQSWVPASMVRPADRPAK